MQLYVLCHMLKSGQESHLALLNYARFCVLISRQSTSGSCAGRTIWSQHPKEFGLATTNKTRNMNVTAYAKDIHLEAHLL